MIWLNGCGTDSSSDGSVCPIGLETEPTLPDDISGAGFSAGTIHNEFLELQASLADEHGQVDASLQAANMLVDRYDGEHFTRRGVEDYLALGQHLATMTTEEIASLVLDGEDLDWYLEFVDVAVPETVEEDLAAFIKR